MKLPWFDEMCRQRHDAGVRERRGGDPNAPFAGDPLHEMLQELADAENYLREEARRNGFNDDPRGWNDSWHHRWEQIRELAQWAKFRQMERTARTNGGIVWSCSGETGSIAD